MSTIYQTIHTWIQADLSAIPKMQTAMESCLGKTILSGGMGFVLGGAFGLFMSSVCSSPSCSFFLPTATGRIVSLTTKMFENR